MTPAAVQGTLVTYRRTKDGGLTISIELDEFQAVAFHESFPGVNLAVAVARLNEDSATRLSDVPEESA
jgi:hypothetical protein